MLQHEWTSIICQVKEALHKRPYTLWSNSCGNPGSGNLSIQAPSWLVIAQGWECGWYHEGTEEW